jgi:hypothetical protein
VKDHLFAVGALFVALATPLSAASIYLDGDSPSTGSLLGTTPLVTPLGTVTFTGEFNSTPSSDAEFVAAGSTGNIFDVPNTSGAATLFFNFDVASITFIYGGNTGPIQVEARNSSNVAVALFYQADTDVGQPAGPVTLTGTGIRSLWWDDTEGGFYAPLDNILISNVPEPTPLMLAIFGAVFFLGRARPARGEMRGALRG